MSRFDRNRKSQYRKKYHLSSNQKDKLLLASIAFIVSLIIFSYVYYEENESEVQEYLSRFEWYQVWDIVHKEKILNEKYGTDEPFLPDTR